jgi:predicted phosphohydrolase
MDSFRVISRSYSNKNDLNHHLNSKVKEVLRDYKNVTVYDLLMALQSLHTVDNLGPGWSRFQMQLCKQWRSLARDTKLELTTDLGKDLYFQFKNAHTVEDICVVFDQV